MEKQQFILQLGGDGYECGPSLVALLEGPANEDIKELAREFASAAGLSTKDSWRLDEIRARRERGRSLTYEEEMEVRRKQRHMQKERYESLGLGEHYSTAGYFLEWLTKRGWTSINIPVLTVGRSSDDYTIGPIRSRLIEEDEYEADAEDQDDLQDPPEENEEKESEEDPEQTP